MADDIVKQMEERHEELHRALDELTACYINVTGNLPSTTSLFEFMAWASEMRGHPACAGHARAVAKTELDGIDFEGLWREFAALLDAIEISVDNEDYEKVKRLTMNRFDVVEQHGLEVQIIGITSGETH
jgi:hypothetical protein